MMTLETYRAYRTLPIAECGEPLMPVAGPHLVLAEPHPYVLRGAPYGEVSPWFLRESVLAALNRAAGDLQLVKPGWRILLTDALRPVAVQRFLVDWQLRELAAAEGLEVDVLEEVDRARLMEVVWSIWAVPSDDPATPPPHSTGAALDCTLLDEHGQPVAMGGEIDQVGEISRPDFYAGMPGVAARFAANRALLREMLEAQGFRRHPAEWWHFSLGDQLWAWVRQREGDETAMARFGRANELKL